MLKPELPSSFARPSRVTDRQIAAFVIDLCRELRLATDDPRFGAGREEFHRRIERIQAEARLQARDQRPSDD